MTVSQIMWCFECEEALKDENPAKALQDWYKKSVGQINDMMELVRSNLTKIERKKIVALVTTGK